jgi:hypothetical protein
MLFNIALKNARVNDCGEVIPTEDIFYIYRWCTGSRHLSGLGDLPKHWDIIGQQEIKRGTFFIEPHWRNNYVALAKQAQRIPKQPRDWSTLSGYFDFAEVYDRAVAEAPPGSTLVEIGCLGGQSLCYLGKRAKDAGKRLRVVGVCLGIGVDELNYEPDFNSTPATLAAIRECGLADTVTLISGESTRVAQMFPNGSLEFVFIDGAHCYNSCLSDIQAWVSKVRRGGKIAGHDLGMVQFPGVERAVFDYFGRVPKDLKEIEQPNVWHAITGIHFRD